MKTQIRPSVGAVLGSLITVLTLASCLLYLALNKQTERYNEHLKGIRTPQPYTVQVLDKHNVVLSNKKDTIMLFLNSTETIKSESIIFAKWK